MFACAVLISRTADGWIVGLGVALAIASVLWYIRARAAAYRETTGGGWLHALTVVFGGFLATTVLIFAFLGLALLE